MLFAVVNDFSFGLFAENVLVLYAIKDDVPEHVAVILPSFMFPEIPFSFITCRPCENVLKISPDFNIGTPC